MLEGDNLEEEAEKEVMKLRRDGVFNGQISDKDLLGAVIWGIRQYGVDGFKLSLRSDPDKRYQLIYLAKH